MSPSARASGRYGLWPAPEEGDNVSNITAAAPIPPALPPPKDTQNPPPGIAFHHFFSGLFRFVSIISVSTPASPVFACYTRIRGTNAILNSLETQANHPGDASCQKNPQDASPDFGPPPQPTGKKGLTSLQMTTPHTRTRRIAAPHHPCDASCEKSPQDASQNFSRPPQPTEK